MFQKLNVVRPHTLAYTENFFVWLREAETPLDTTHSHGQRHTHTHTQAGTRMRDWRHTNRRRDDEATLAALARVCGVFVSMYVCLHVTVRACKCVCVCLRLPQFLGSLSRSHWLSHTRISLFATSLRFSYCCCYYYYYNYLLIQYLELFTAFNYSRYCA